MIYIWSFDIHQPFYYFTSFYLSLNFIDSVLFISLRAYKILISIFYFYFKIFCLVRIPKVLIYKRHTNAITSKLIVNLKINFVIAFYLMENTEIAFSKLEFDTLFVLYTKPVIFKNFYCDKIDTGHAKMCIN